MGTLGFFYIKKWDTIGTVNKTVQTKHQCQGVKKRARRTEIKKSYVPASATILKDNLLDTGKATRL